MAEEKTIAEIIAEKIGDTDPEQVTEALNQWMNGAVTRDNERLIRTIGDYTFDQIEEDFQNGSSTFLEYLATKSEQSAAAVVLMKSSALTYKDAMLEAKEIMGETGSVTSLENINQFLNLVDIGEGEGQTKYEDYAYGIRDAYKIMTQDTERNVEDLRKALSDAGIKMVDVAEVIETISKDVMDMD